MTDKEKLEDYPLLKEELETTKERLEIVFTLVRASEMMEDNNKLAKFIRKEVFPSPDFE